VNLPKEYFDKDGIYEIKAIAYDVSGNNSGEKIYTYVVMHNTAMMAYIPEESLGKFNNIGIRAIDFTDIPLCVYVVNDSDFTIKIGETLLGEGDYTIVGEKDIVNQVKEYQISIPQKFISNIFSENNQVYDLPINVINNSGQILTLGRVVVDNVKPFGEFESDFTKGKGYYGKKSKDIQLIRLSDDIDQNKTKITVDGTDVEFIYNPDSKTITFSLEKSSAFGHPWAGHNIKVTLVDTAGNEYALDEVNYVYIGNWFLRFWLFFAVGTVSIVSIGIWIYARNRHKKPN